MAYLFALIIFIAQIAAMVSVVVIGITLVARVRRASTLWLLSVVTSRNLPIDSELEAFGEGFLSGDRRRVGQILGMLHAGSTLAEALSRTPGFVSDDAVVFAHVGERTNRLSEAFAMEAERLARIREMSVMQTSSPSLTLLYLFVIPLIVPVIVAGLMIFIIPKLKKIFDDFGTELPWITEQFINSSDILARYWYLGLFLIMAAAMFLAGLLALGRLSTWDLRIPRWITPGGRARRASLALRSLAIAASANRSVDLAIEPMAKNAPNPSDRHVFERVRQRFRAGESLWQTLATERIVSADESQLLSAAEISGNLPWTLTLLADRNDERNRRRFAMALEFVQPMIVILLGGAVFFVCVSIFQPLVQLLYDLS